MDARADHSRMGLIVILILLVVVGPLAEASAGPFVVFDKVGVSAVRVERVDYGLLAVGGVGAMF